MDTRIPLRVRWKHLLAAINALLFHGDHLHEMARHEPDQAKSAALREDAETAAAARHEFWLQQHGGAVNDESVSVTDSGHAQIVKTAPVAVRQAVNISERTLTILAFALSLISLVFVLFVNRDNDRQYRHLQELRIRVEDAEMAAERVDPNFHPIRQPKESK